MNPSRSFSFQQIATFAKRVIGADYRCFPVDRNNPTSPRFGCLTVIPTDHFTSEGESTFPFSPPAAVFVVKNTGGATVNWVLQNAPSWLVFDISGGTLEPDQQVTITGTVDPSASPPDTYDATLTFHNGVAGVCPDTLVDVTMIVNPYIPPEPGVYPINDVVFTPFVDTYAIFTVPSLAGFESNEYVWEYSDDNGVHWGDIDDLVQATPSFQSLTINPSITSDNLNGYKFRLTVNHVGSGQKISDPGTLIEGFMDILTPVTGPANCMTGNPLVKTSTIYCDVDAPWLSPGNPVPGVTFQWQLAPIDTMVWTDITNGGVVTNATTKQMNLSSITYPYTNDAQNGAEKIHYFRCKLTYGTAVGYSTTDYMQWNCPPPP